MIKRFANIFLFFCFSVSVLAQDVTLKSANNLYSKGDYTAAALQYEIILEKQGIAPEVYYNLGNAYYKLNETNRSILNYERALRLSPDFEDAKINLSMAQAKVIDNIVYSPDFFIMNWMNFIVKLMSSNNWLYFSVIMLLLSIIACFIFLFANSRSARKTSFYFSTVFLSFCIVSLVFSGVRKDQLVNHRDAIIMSGVVVAKSSPDKSGTDLFQLHEGTKVKIKSTLGNWVEIKIGNGEIGWVQLEEIERI
ncbi:MAG: tetratricopeptide repeat protein [Paludibacter sp.]|nr:tetratricopeptide repeat protein [Paludibacter sp.]